MTNKKIFSTLFIGTALGVWAQMASAEVIPAGTRIEVRTEEGINARDYVDNRIYPARVAREVVDYHDRVLIPRGAPAELIVRRLGEHEIAIDLEAVRVGGRYYTINALTRESTRREGVGANKRTGEFVGGGALVGTLLGAIAGGGKGAAIGALAGGAAGATGQMLTRGHDVHIPPESILTFRLDRPLEIHAERGTYRNGHHYHDYYNDENRGYPNQSYQNPGYQNNPNYNYNYRH